MNKTKIVGEIVSILTLISPIAAFALTCLIGEVEIFGVGGIARYSWIMWLFIPFGILSIFIANKLKAEDQSYKEHYIIAFICIPLLMLFGFSGCHSYDPYDAGRVAEVESRIGLDLPNDVKIATSKSESHYESYIKVYSGEEKERFERELAENPVWREDVGTKIASLLPEDIQYKLGAYDRMTFYNLTENEFNEYPPDGEYECIFIAYDYELQKMFILDGFSVVLN